MTIGVAWVARRSDGLEHLYLATDSRTRGARLFDYSPKIMLLPRSDAAICFSGKADLGYPMLHHISQAIAAHEPARDRNLDIRELVTHLLKVLTDVAESIRDDLDPFENHDPEFIFAGYSWKAKDFCIWTIDFDVRLKKFVARESESFHPKLRKAAFTGDRARSYRSVLVQSLNRIHTRPQVHMEPLRILAREIKQATHLDSIGGSPQLVRIGTHMNARPLSVLWGPRRIRHIFGRPLLEYENCDYWAVDPHSGKTFPPDHRWKRSEVDKERRNRWLGRMAAFRTHNKRAINK